MTGAAHPDATRSSDPRLLSVERLLRERGLEGVRLAVAGHRDEIVAISVTIRQAPLIGDLAGEIRALGFQYVALDLASLTGEP